MPKAPTPHAEHDLIAQIRHRFAQPRTSTLALGIGDDCAILRPPSGHDLLVTTDFTLEDRHFRRAIHPPHAVGHRTLARGLSDLAAMGATPLAAFLSLALPAGLPRSPAGRRWIARFLDGLQDLARSSIVPLAGGDTSQSPADTILADIVLLGSAPTGSALRRSTARPGDLLFVSGTLGGAAAELRSLLTANRPARPRSTSGRPHLYPQPRLALGHTLRRRNLASACIDLSDGLSTDLAHLCTASRLTAEIDVSHLPVHPLAAVLPDALQLALHGGEDYELLFTASPTARIPATLAGVPLTCIGRMRRTTPGRAQVVLVGPGTLRTHLEPGGWEHFAS